MDHIVKAGELQIVAKRKRIAKQRKKKAKQLMKETEERSKTDRMDDDALGELWSELISEIRDVLDGKIAANDDISPINILLKVSDEQHQ
jgi:flagellar biosynthesis/type III secretory pathway chaperone